MRQLTVTVTFMTRVASLLGGIVLFEDNVHIQALVEWCPSRLRAHFVTKQSAVGLTASPG